MGANWQPLNNLLWLSIPLITAGAFINFANTVVAQVTPDQSLGKENSVVTPVDPNSERIDGGAVRGSNLFHSFKEFNVGEGKRIDFANPAGIENILSRVTGNNPSNIFGTLGVLGDANLFLLNPNGIIFGPNSRLDIRGSFVASTGEGINFADRILYGGNNLDSKPLLTMAVPVGLQYGTQQAGDINNQGNLQVGAGQKLALAGNNVTSSGKLTAPGGTVHVLGERVGLVDNARIDVSGYTGGGNVLIGGDFQGKGEVPNAKRTFVSSGASINADAVTSGDGGRVIVWADETTGFYGDISARGGSQFGNGGFAEVSGKENLIFRGDVDLGAGNGSFGTLLLDPRDIVISKDVSDSSGVKDKLNPEGSNEPADILKNDFDRTPITISQARLEKIGEKNAVELEATNDITIGNLKEVEYKDSPNKNQLTFKEAPGQSITFKADADGNGVGSFKMNQEDTIRTNGRDIEISGASIEVGDIDTSSSFGDGGDVTLKASNGGVTAGNLDSSSFAVNENQEPIANGGNINLEATGIINTGLIDTAGVNTPIAGRGALNGANVSIKSFNEAIIFTKPNSSGSNIVGKSITINTPSTIFAEGGFNARSDTLGNVSEIKIGNIFAPSSINIAAIGTRNLRKGCGCNVGNGGNINIKTTGLLEVTSAFSENLGILNDPRNPNNISIGSQAIGNGGTIDIVADGGIQTRAGIVSNSLSNGKGGNITLTSNNGLIDIQAGTIDSSSRSGNGGEIKLTAAKNITTGSILSNSRVSGNGGDITLISNDGRIDTTAGIVNASAVFDFGIPIGNAGNVLLKAENGNILSGSIESIGLQGGSIKLNSSNDISITEHDVVSATTGGISKGGDIELIGKNINLIDARVVNITTGEQPSGNITLNASEQVNLVNNGKSGGSASGGSDLFDRLQQIRRFEGGTGIVTTTTPLDKLLEDIGIASESLIGVIPNSTESTGKAGDITITTKNLLIEAKVDSDVLTGISSASLDGKSGNAGNIEINASESLDITGNEKDNDFKATPVDLEKAREVQAIFTGITSATMGEGNAGSIKINPNSMEAGNLKIENGAAITSSSSETAKGDGGAIAINASSLELNNKAAIATATVGLGEGNTGNLTINVPEGNIELGDGALIASDSTRSEDAGGLDITASNIYLGSNSRIGAAIYSKEGQGGDININVAKDIKFKGKDSEISSEATFSEGATNANGGNLTIKVGRFIESSGIPNNNDIVVTANGRGVGGKLLSEDKYGSYGFVNFDKFRTPDSDFTAASRLGQDGTLDLDTNNPQPQLPQQPNTPEIVQVCPASQGVTTRAAGRSEYINTGHGGLPPNPNQALESNTAQVPWVTLNPQENKPTASSKPKVIREAQGWVKMPNGKLLLTTRKSNSSSSSCVFQSN